MGTGNDDVVNPGNGDTQITKGKTTMSNEWSIARDGDSLAMLQSPDGRVFRIQQLGTGDPWGNAEDNDALVEQLALAAADAKRFRWLLFGNGYFLEEELLCGHDPCSTEEENELRKAVDEAMAAIPA